MSLNRNLALAGLVASQFAAGAIAAPFKPPPDSAPVYRLADARRYCWRADSPSGPVQRCRPVGDDYYRGWFNGSDDRVGGRGLHGRHRRGKAEDGLRIGTSAAGSGSPAGDGGGSRGEMAGPDRGAAVGHADRGPPDRGAASLDRPRGPPGDIDRGPPGLR